MAEADPKIVNVHDDAETQLSRLMERAHAGEEIILARAGKPYARLGPVDRLGPVEAPVRRARKPGGWPQLAAIPDSVWFDPLPDDELDAWEGKYSNLI